MNSHQESLCPATIGRALHRTIGDVFSVLGTQLREAFQDCLREPGHLSWAQKAYVRVGTGEKPDPSPEFLSHWTRLIDALCSFLRDCDRVVSQVLLRDAQERQKPAATEGLALLIEGLLNECLLRQNLRGDPQLCWGSCLSYAQAAGRVSVSTGRVQAAGLQLSLHSQGVRVDTWPQLVKAGSSDWRPPAQLISQPVRSTPLCWLGLAVPQHLFQIEGYPGMGCSVGDFLACAEGQERLPSNLYQRILTLLRFMQRESCALTEDWEFQNSVLAMRLVHQETASGQRISQEGDSRAEEMRDLVLSVAQCRDEIAHRFAWVLAEFQQCLLALQNTLAGSNDMEERAKRDLQEEWLATDRVVLAAMQKLFLPASVSRHDYHKKVRLAVRVWGEARHLCSPDDAASELALLAFSSADLSGDDFTTQISAFLRKSQSLPTLDWYMAFDPSAAIKAFSWGVSRTRHVALVAALGLLVARRHSSPGRDPDVEVYDSYWSQTLLGALTMPATFPALRDSYQDMRHVREELEIPLLQETLRLCTESMPEMSGEDDEFHEEGLRETWCAGLAQAGFV